MRTVCVLLLLAVLVSVSGCGKPDSPAEDTFRKAEELKMAERYSDALRLYKKAIDNYPKTDRYHLNEVYNNIGSVYYELKNYKNHFSVAFVAPLHCYLHQCKPLYLSGIGQLALSRMVWLVLWYCHTMRYRKT